MPAVRLLTTVEHRAVLHDGVSQPSALNDIARADVREVSRAELEDGITAVVLKLPEGSEIDLPQRSADELTRLGYAEAV